MELGRGAAALSDLSTTGELRRLPLWVDLYAPRGTADQLLCMATLDRRHGTTLAFNRSRRGFSDRDRAIAELIVPHLAQAMDRHARQQALAGSAHRQARYAEQLDAAAEALPSLTPAERRVLDQLAGGGSPTARSLARSRSATAPCRNIWRTPTGSWGSATGRAWSRC